jgi:outer membrane lipoprotein-sorting protein
MMKNLVIVILILAAFSLGCGLFDRLKAPNVTNVASNSSTTTASTGDGSDAAPPSGDPRNDVITASKKFLDLPQFSAEMNGRGKMDMRMKLDYQAPDRYHMTSLTQSEVGMSEFYIIGKDMYFRTGEKWQKMPGAAGQSMPNLRKMFDEDGLKSLQNVEYLGEDSLDGEAMHKYAYRNTKTGPDVPYPFKSTIWVSKSDGLPHKIEVEYEQGDLKSMTINYDFSSKVDIKPPV